MLELSASDLNLLFDAALEFGTNWRRPVRDLADERLPTRTEDYRASISTVVQQCRADIERRVWDVYEREHGAWTRATAHQVRGWIREQFDWMTDDNARRAIGQGLFYAWKG